ICVMSQGRVEQLGTPTEVYRTPSTAFVARFVGSMNEFAAQVTGSGEVAIGGMRVGAPGAASAAVGSAVSMLVRPEDLALSESGLPGSVTAVTFQGATTLVGVRLDVLDHLVSVDVGQGAADHLQLGDRVAVSVNGANAVCEPA
ncbi:MAG: TOBE domain-containing protein, partial [Actinomycetota bacterium]|nr:TOBE domain-containing protein [Actinomycetota bacterium]